VGTDQGALVNQPLARATVTTYAAAAVLFGRTRRCVPGWLFGHPDEAFFLRQIVRQTGAPLGALHRELALLEHERHRPAGRRLVSREPRLLKPILDEEPNRTRLFRRPPAARLNSGSMVRRCRFSSDALISSSVI